MDIRDEIEQIKGEIKILKTGYAAIFGGDIIDIRGTGITHDFIIPSPEVWILEREMQIEDLEYKLEALRLAEDIIKIFPKFFGSNPSRDYEWNLAEEINGILKRAKEIRNKTIGD